MEQDIAEVFKTSFTGTMKTTKKELIAFKTTNTIEMLLKSKLWTYWLILFDKLKYNTQMLQHEAMVADEWQDDRPEISPWYLWAFKLPSIKCPCVSCFWLMHVRMPYHYPPTTGHSSPNTDIRKPIANPMPYLLPTICQIQWKLGIVWREHYSKVQNTTDGEHFPFKSIELIYCGQVKTSTNEHSTALRRFLTGSQPKSEVKKPDVTVLGWHSYTMSVVARPVGCTPSFCETTFEAAYGGKMNIQFTGNNSGGHYYSYQANCTFPHVWHLWFCVCIKELHILECPLIVTTPRHTF